MAIQNNQNSLRYNLFGKPNKSVVVKPGADASGAVAVGTGVQPSTGNVEAPRVGVSPTTSNNIGISGVKNGGGDAIKNVGGDAAGVGAPISKDKFVGSMQAKTQPMDYIAALNKQKEAQKNVYVPDAENKGRGVARWLSNVFSSPKVQTKEESRRAQQNIAVLGDTMRHLANLWWVGKKDASPQTIQSQAAVNDAKWKAEDALEAEKEKQTREWALKQQKQAADEAYKAGQLGLSADRNAETKRNNAFNNQIALGNYGLRADANKRDNELHPYTMAEKAAGVEYDKARAEKAKSDAKYADLKNSKQVELINARIKAANSTTSRNQVATQKLRKEYKDLVAGKGDFVLSGNRGSFSRKKATTEAEKTNIITRLHEAGIVSDEDWNAVHTKSSWLSADQIQKKQDDIISDVLNGAGDDEVVRDIFTSNGFTYKDYKPATMKFNPER